jgi:hypothetical protein
MFTVAIAVITVIAVYTFITGLVETVLKCWRDAKLAVEAVGETAGKAALPENPEEPEKTEEPEETEEITNDPWDDETVAPASIEKISTQSEYKILILPPASKKKLQKPISKMLKIELQAELSRWCKSTEGTVKELKSRLEACYNY